MAAPLLFILGGVIVRASTPAIAKRLTAAGFRKASSSVAKSKANITTATNSNIISLITRGLKGARTTTKGKITKPTTRVKPKTAQEVRDALKRNAEKVSGKEFGKRKLSEFGPVGSQPKPTLPKPKPKPKPKVKPKPKSSKTTVLSTAALLAATPKKIGFGEMTKAEQEEVKKANAENAKFKEKVGKLKDKKGKTAEEIREIAEKALKSVDVEDAALLKREQKYVPKDIDKLMSSLRPRARPETQKKTLSAFGSAFSNARKAKKYSFKFKGKEYTTRLKKETVAEHKKKFLKKKD